jgi:hypothetical protein
MPKSRSSAVRSAEEAGAAGRRGADRSCIPEVRVLLNLRPDNLPADAVNGDGKGDPGTGYVVVMSLGAVGCAVVVNEGPDRRCPHGRDISCTDGRDRTGTGLRI